MSNACGRLMGTLGSGVLYTCAGDDRGSAAGSDALRGLAACFIAGTISSLLAALITLKIQDDAAGLRCGRCLVCVDAQPAAPKEAAKSAPQKATPTAEPPDASEVAVAKNGPPAPETV